MKRRLLFGLVLTALSATRTAPALECSAIPEPCVDAEPLWLPAGAGPFVLLAGTRATPAWQLGVDLTFMLRLRPAVLLAPAPSRGGREVNAIRLAADGAMSWSLGLGHGLEFSGATPLGLYQTGAGIKGVTRQQAAPLASTAVHDPRFALAYAAGGFGNHAGAKARLELKLPLGDGESLASEPSVVLSPSLTLDWASSPRPDRDSGFFMGFELGLRLRATTHLLDSRFGSQAVLTAGVGYAVAQPRLRFSVEAYALPSLVRSGSARQLPSEWLTSAAFSPAAEPELSFGLGAGAGIPLSSNAVGDDFAGFGVPAFRGLAFARYTPAADH